MPRVHRADDPTRPTITIDRTDVASMRMINPMAIATIRLLIDCLIIDPENFFQIRKSENI